MAADTYIISDDDLLKLFTNVAPICVDTDQFNSAMTTEQGKVNLIIALQYFCLGVRAGEHVQNHHEWTNMLADAGDPEHPQMALPGVDFDTTNILADLKKRLQK